MAKKMAQEAKAFAAQTWKPQSPGPVEKCQESVDLDMHDEALVSHHHVHARAHVCIHMHNKYK